MDTLGNIHSIQTLGTLDGPGVRCVIFLQGCPLRCKYCHNPDTWGETGGTFMNVSQVMNKILRCKPYFGGDGGVTVSGGEALLQPEFTAALFDQCHKHGIHTALDTSGCICNENTDKLLDKCDLCLLDIKACDEPSYYDLCGGSLSSTLLFLNKLGDKNIKTWIRQVIVPGLNDTPEQVLKLKELTAPYTCIQKTELLPFKKLCSTKYGALGIAFPFASIPEPSEETVRRLQAILEK